MANTTLSQLRTKGRQEIKLDRIGRIWNDSEWTDALNEAKEAIEQFANFGWPQNQERFPTFNSVAQQAEYDLPTDYQGEYFIKYNNVPLAPTSLIDIELEHNTPPSGNPTAYYMFGGKLGLHPIPASIKTIDITYKKILPNLADEDDQSSFPTSFDRAMVLFACFALLTKPADRKNFDRARVKLEGRYNKEIAKLYNMFGLPNRGEIRYKSSYPSRSSSSRRRFTTLSV